MHHSHHSFKNGGSTKHLRTDQARSCGKQKGPNFSAIDRKQLAYLAISGGAYTIRNMYTAKAEKHHQGRRRYLGRSLLLVDQELRYPFLTVAEG